MNTLAPTNKFGSLPLERKNQPVQRPSDITVETEGIDKIGFFDESLKAFDATYGSIDDFNADTTIQPSILSDMFGGSDQWVSITPALNIADTTAAAVSKAADVVGNLASAGKDAKDAYIDLFNQVTGKAEVPQAIEKAFAGEDPSNLSPDLIAKKQEEAEKTAEYSANRQREEAIEADMLNISRKTESQIKIKPLQEEISDLAKLQALLSGKSGLVNEESGEIRIDLQSSVAQKRKEILASQQGKNLLSSPAKHGPEGPRLSNDDNKSGETHSTAQTATG